MAGAFEKHNGCDLDQQNVFANYTAQTTRHGKTSKAAAKSANVQRVYTDQDTKDAHAQHAKAFAALRPRVYGAAKAGLYEDVYDARNAIRTLYINLFDGPDGLNEAAILVEQQRVQDLKRRHDEAVQQHRKATEEASERFRLAETGVEQRYKKQLDELKNKYNRRLQDLKTEHQRLSGEAADLAGEEMQRQLDLLANKHRDDRHKLKSKLREEAEAKSNEQLKTVKDGHVTAVKKLWDHLDDRNRTVKEKSRADARAADQRL
ncbi:hypothetical protein LTR56_020963 [Elasticomyces elasticus]|nr:hypothetical protein LTR56_020963 [Elasticomyces elasticus]KAK3646046.1 hypothetical protein LTR22_014481 [Elasticomyces elasticus]KAK4909796.1 hypothetical protein LTR49_021465 [Elasticomyces elasticus]KAK5761772.1 hypothetical protein LTS12_008027 [Elasticomyces elasticus]